MRIAASNEWCSVRSSGVPMCSSRSRIASSEGCRLCAPVSRMPGMFGIEPLCARKSMPISAPKRLALVTSSVPGLSCRNAMRSCSFFVPTSTRRTNCCESTSSPYSTFASSACFTSAIVSCSIFSSRGSSATGQTSSSSSAARTSALAPS